MFEYTFKYGPFFAKIHADNDKEAVSRFRRAIEESFPGDTTSYLNVDLTAGAFEGQIHVETREISSRNIFKKEPVSNSSHESPF